MAKELNRNARRSIKLLQEAFLQLLAEKPFDKITVSDVTRRAGLNRGTFYAHFDGMADLLEQMMAVFSKALFALVEQVIDLSFVENPLPVLDEIGDFVSENREQIRDIVGSNSASPFVDALEGAVKGQVRQTLLDAFGNDAPFALVTADYLAGGALRAYAAWVMGDYGNRPISDVNRELGMLVKSTCKTLGDVVPLEVIAAKEASASDNVASPAVEENNATLVGA